ncbi:MAG TPA: O-antigen ligase family protein [Bryobacteraceae bacterium]|nr:O-antigen ligase family protein [Bryobacteraceae bacterium]
MPLFTLAALSAILAVAAFNNGGSDVPAWHYCASALGSLGLIYIGVRAVQRRWMAAISGPMLALLGFTVALCALQLIPLPRGVLQILSPSSLEIYSAAAQAGAANRFFPISVMPSATLDAMLALLACIVVFALVADMAAEWASREPQRTWRLAIPLVVLGVLEAVLGILQAAAGSKPGGATGTYQNRNHFAGLLEMCLPFAAMFAFAAWRRVTRHQGVAWKAVLETWGWLAAVAVMLLAVAASLSRMGFAAALAGLFASGAAALVIERRDDARRAGRGAWLPVAAAAGVVLLLAVLLPSISLIQRFDGASGAGEISSDARLGIWRDTLHLVRAFPLVGCGLGAFQSAYMRYQTVAPLLTVNFAHNDYLQLLAELGAAGFLALLMVAAMVYRALWRKLGERGETYFYAACLGALVAISLHSLVDFNLYKPANAMVVAWVAGMSASKGGRL